MKVILNQEQRLEWTEDTGPLVGVDALVVIVTARGRGEGGVMLVCRDSFAAMTRDGVLRTNHVPASSVSGDDILNELE